jgi:hypothetical protein
MSGLTHICATCRRTYEINPVTGNKNGAVAKPLLLLWLVASCITIYYSLVSGIFSIIGVIVMIIMTRNSNKKVCDSCGKKELIPIDSPAGIDLASKKDSTIESSSIQARGTPLHIVDLILCCLQLVFIPIGISRYHFHPGLVHEMFTCEMIARAGLGLFGIIGNSLVLKRQNIGYRFLWVSIGLVIISIVMAIMVNVIQGQGITNQQMLARLRNITVVNTCIRLSYNFVFIVVVMRIAAVKSKYQ